MSNLLARPISLREANAFVATVHRHHGADRGHKFSISAWRDNKMVGVVIVGRPKGRGHDHTKVAEVTRLATTGDRNACSFLYARAAQACRAMGYEVVVTYTLVGEPGTSLRAAGWVCDGQVRCDGKGWNNRPNRQKENQGPKLRWRKPL